MESADLGRIPQQVVGAYKNWKLNPDTILEDSQNRAIFLRRLEKYRKRIETLKDSFSTLSKGIEKEFQSIEKLLKNIHIACRDISISQEFQDRLSVIWEIYNNLNGLKKEVDDNI